MLRKIWIVVLALSLIAFNGALLLSSDLHAAQDTTKCQCKGDGKGGCQCGKDCKCGHCADGKGKCQCKGDGKGCQCGKDCKCGHCADGKGKCQCKSDGKGGCQCGKDCKCGHCSATVAKANDKPSSEKDYATAGTSKASLYKVSYTSEPAAVPVNTIHSWKLKVETAEGQPVKNAKITLKGLMPEHGHGMPTQPKVTKNLGDGTYLVEGMKFSMPGWWVITFHIKAGGKTDSITFNLDLK